MNNPTIAGASRAATHKQVHARKNAVFGRVGVSGVMPGRYSEGEFGAGSGQFRIVVSVA